MLGSVNGKQARLNSVSSLQRVSHVRLRRRHRHTRPVQERAVGHHPRRDVHRLQGHDFYTAPRVLVALWSNIKSQLDTQNLVLSDNDRLRNRSMHPIQDNFLLIYRQCTSQHLTIPELQLGKIRRPCSPNTLPSGEVGSP